MYPKSFLLAFCVLAVAAGPSLADKKKLAIVVSGRDDPFYQSVGDGCARWNADHKDADYECVFAGPASGKDRQGEMQALDDMITTGAAAIAIAPSDPAATAKLLAERQPPMPIMTLSVDLAAADKGLRRTTLLPAGDYDVGVGLAKALAGLKPAGGSLCLVAGKSGADATARAAGFRDTAAGAKDTAKLTGQHGWTEAAGCPAGEAATGEAASQQVADALAAMPDLGALVLLDGLPLTAPKSYAKALLPAADRLKAGDLAIVAADTPPAPIDIMKAGRLQAAVGQRSANIGRSTADILLELASGRSMPDPVTSGLDICTVDALAACSK